MIELPSLKLELEDVSRERVGEGQGREGWEPLAAAAAPARAGAGVGAAVLAHGGGGRRGRRSHPGPDAGAAEHRLRRAG